MTDAEDLLRQATHRRETTALEVQTLLDALAAEHWQIRAMAVERGVSLGDGHL